jgi:hypothetical protein
MSCHFAARVSGLVGEPTNETEKSRSPRLAFLAGPTSRPVHAVLGGVWFIASRDNLSTPLHKLLVVRKQANDLGHQNLQ